LLTKVKPNAHIEHITGVQRHMGNVRLTCLTAYQGRSRRSGWSGYNHTTFRPIRYFFLLPKCLYISPTESAY